MPQVTLEARTAAHAEELYAILSDPVLYAFIEEDPPASLDAFRRRLAATESRKSPDGSEHWLNWVVRDMDGRAAGYVQATARDSGPIDVAYVIGRAFWGRGIATAAVARMLDLLAAEFGGRDFALVAERRNLGSIGVARRLGFSEASPEAAARRNLPATDVLMTRPSLAAESAP
jgi:ribosomal-protein-alanine N-acetyltransferase